MPKIIAKEAGFVLVHNKANKSVTLVSETSPATPLLYAKFAFDPADGSALLSHFEYVPPHKYSNLVLTATNMVSNYLSGIKDKCKLLCHAGKFKTELEESKDYRSADIDRLMLRENNQKLDSLVKKPRAVSINILDKKTATTATFQEMALLLKNNAYWATNIDEQYIRKAVENSTCILATKDKSKIVGFVRYIANGDFAYISDMVVGAEWRKKKIGTALMQKACGLIDSQKRRFTALISAKEGDGQKAAAQLYGKKFGFKDYAGSHEHTIFFRYIRMTPANKLKIQRLKHKTNTLNSNFKFTTSSSTLFNSQKTAAVMQNGSLKLHSGPVRLLAAAENTGQYTKSSDNVHPIRANSTPSCRGY